MLFSLPLLLLSALLVYLSPVHAIKFNLQAHRYPPPKCIWNSAHANSLVIVTANVGPGANQRVDIDIVDSSPKKNVYLSKKNIKSESRLAITTHSEGEVGVCFKNHIEGGTCQLVQTERHKSNLFLQVVSYEAVPKLSRVIDLDVDIGADAVDYKYVLIILLTSV